jgi:hypothetical protein
MEGPSEPGSRELAHKIARLAAERGWNREEFARIARLNRHTVRDILQPEPSRQLRNSTVSACARALGLSVSDLRDLPLDRLLPRMRAASPADGADAVRRLFDQASQPELLAWMERNPDRASRLSAEEVDELLASQGTNGPLAEFGIEKVVARLERRRKVIQQVHAIAGTDYLDLLEQLVALIFEKVQPGRERSG